MHRRDVEKMQAELEEIFSDLWQVPGFLGRRGGFRPAVDCYRSDESPAVTVVVDLAGIDPDDVQIAVSERTVTIAGTRRRPPHDCRVSYRQMEIDYGPFQRRIALAEDVDPDRAEASYDRGLLTIVMPLADRPRVGRIAIVVQRRSA